MRQWARATTAAGQAAYLYFFTHPPPHPRASDLKAFHAGEIPYVFNVVPSSDPREAGFAYREVDRQLADAMSTYWINFITRGDPNGAGLPQWDAYALETEPYLEFGGSIKAGSHLLKRQLDFLDKALARRP
jgi:para-nitrobenzyl esterase